MINEYSRTGMLLGNEGIERLKNAAVMVFGVGGVGSHCIEALARSGVGRLILIDCLSQHGRTAEDRGYERADS